MLVAWVAFPALLGLACVGAGLLVERAGGFRLPGVLLAPLGFAGLVCLTRLTLRWGTLAPLTPWIALVVVLAGLWLGRRRLRGGLDRWALATAVVVYAVYAAPALLTGAPTFLGYTNLGDASIHFEIVARLFSDGPSVAGLPPSSYQLSLFNYFSTAYPTGGHGVLGTVRAWLGMDVAWAFQPYLSAMAALLALALLGLLRGLTRRRWLAAGAAGFAAQASLAYSYAQDQQAIKEIATLVTLATLVALVAPTVARRPTWRCGLPLVVAAGGALGVLGLAIAPWGVPVLAVALLLVVVRHRRRGWRPIAAQVAGFAVVGIVIALPTLFGASAFVATNTVTLQAAQEFGNLGTDPLVLIQALGVWPTRDFRLPLAGTGGVPILLVGAAALAALLGVVAVVRARAWSVLLLAAVSLVAYWAVVGRASPWAAGKALMLLSPVALLVATLAVVLLAERRRVAEAAVVAVALLAGVGLSNAYTYNGVDPAPHDRLDELATIGDRFAGQGPLLYLEYEEFAKYFLREADPAGATESFRPEGIELSGAGEYRFGLSSDLDTFTPASLRGYRLLVVRRGPSASRPPSGWRRVFSGASYDVWRREDSPEVLDHLAAGTRYAAASAPDCAALSGVARTARRDGGRLAYVSRPEPVAFVPAAQDRLPGNWPVDGTDAEVVRPDGRGRVTGAIDVPRAGRYALWLQASLTRDVTVRVDGGRPVTLHPELNPRRSGARLGALDLTAGKHRIALDIPGGSPAPGDGGLNRTLGALLLTTETDPGGEPVRTLPASRWRTLCDQTVDWVEAIR